MEASGIIVRWGRFLDAAIFPWDFRIMKPPFQTSGQGFAAGAACLGIVLCLAVPLPAEARTTLELETGDTLSFEDGSIDMRTGSGELYDVMLLEGDEPVLQADYLFIDASGEINSPDWFIHELLAKNAEVPEESVFIGRLELRDIAVGQLADDEAMASYEQYITDDTGILLENVGMVAEDALFSIDRIASLPFNFAELNSGLQIVTSAGFEVDGMTVMPLEESVPGENPVLDKLAERGISDIGMDLRIATGASLEGDEMQLFYGIEGSMRELAGIGFGIALSMTQDAYLQLVPMLMEPEENGTALIGLSGAVALNGAELVIDDSGLMDILFEIAAEEEGVSERDVRTMARISVAAVVQETFPQNLSRILPPIEAMISQGGRLEIAAMPQMPVPISSSLGFAVLPDLAIDQLGITVTHTP